MDNTAAQLLEKLATQLGTTSQYLWSVLLKQAPIDATISLLQILLLIPIGWSLWKVHKYLTENDYYDNGAEVLIIGAALIYVIFIFVALCSIEDIINGYLHPEYWALEHILNKIKS